jgi:DNA-binding CsgD family transcriptional regulator
MGFFSLFKRKKRSAVRTDDEPGRPKTRESIRHVQGQIDLLNSHLSTIDFTLKTHDCQLAEHQTRLQAQGEKLQSLEQRVTSVAQAPRLVARQTVESDRLIAQTGTGRQFDINRFTEQEKRILAVFFQNRERLMSYADVGAMLNKSAHTAKNQINQIRQKADVFDCAIGSQSRNLFKLKGDLRIEKYLNLGQPVEPPQAPCASDRSDSEQTAVQPEPALQSG